MDLPDFIAAFPALDLPFPPEKVTTQAMRTEDGLGAFFHIHEDVTLPPHSHGDQWGTVIAGRLELTMNGQTTHHAPGEPYFIPAGVEHSVFVPGGPLVFDIFAEPDRYPLKG